MRRSLLRNLQN